MGAPVRALVVDDHENMRQILGMYLRALGDFEIQEANDGVQAWGHLDSFRPDLVVTDFSMPHLDGIAFTHRLRNDQGNPLRDVPVILVTGHAHAEHVIAARKAGVNEFLAKPVTKASLTERVHRVIDRDRLVIRSAAYVGPCRRQGPRAKHVGPFRRADD